LVERRADAVRDAAERHAAHDLRVDLRAAIVAEPVTHDLGHAEIGIDLDQHQMKLEGEAGIHLHAPVGARQRAAGRHRHHVAYRERRLHARRHPVDVAVRDCHQLIPAPAFLRRVLVRHHAVYKDGVVSDKDAPQKSRSWDELVTIAHRNIHRMPAGMEPALAVSHVMPVPTGGTLPGADGRVQMYPCFSFEFHLMLVKIDPDLGVPEIVRYRLGHDCGTQINPKIVRGMTLGGIAHGIGAALYEEFAYNDEGQLIAQTFMDYLLPSSHEVPPVEIVDHETPSPHTVLGQKGSGESGYLGAPAAIANAVNDALRPLGVSVNTLPLKAAKLGDLIAAAQSASKGKK